LAKLSRGRQAIYYINPYTIGIDYTPRDIDSESTKHHIDKLARSINAHGVVEPLTVYWSSGKPVCYIGHCVYLAAIRAIEFYGTKLQSIPVTLDRYGNEIDRTIRLILSNYTKPLDEFELRNAYERLIGYGWGPEKIAAETGQSVSEINSTLAGGAADHEQSVGQSAIAELQEKINLLERQLDITITERDLARKRNDKIEKAPAFPQIADWLEQEAKQEELHELEELLEQERAELAAEQKRDSDELAARQKVRIESFQLSNNSLGASRPNETVPISANDKHEQPDSGVTNFTNALTREIVLAAIQRYVRRPFFTINQIRNDLREFSSGFADRESYSKAITDILNELVDESKIKKLEHPLRGKWSIS
jgi:hypothetical protein